MLPLENKGKRLELLKLTSSEKGPEELGNRISKEETALMRRELDVFGKPHTGISCCCQDEGLF